MIKILKSPSLGLEVGKRLGFELGLLDALVETSTIEFVLGWEIELGILEGMIFGSSLGDELGLIDMVGLSDMWSLVLARSVPEGTSLSYSRRGIAEKYS